MKYFFSERLKGLRKAAGLTQTVLADSIGIPRNKIRDYEIGKSFAGIDTFLAIADFFQVTTDYLYGRSDDPHKNEIILTA